MSFLDTTILFVYVFGVVAFGIALSKKASTPEGFTAANRNLPGWLVGLSIFGTYLSSISFLALPGKSFGGNCSAFAFSLSLPLAAYAATRWFAPLYRSTNDISAYAYLERRFGLWARLYAMTCYLLTQLARVGTILYLVAIALQQFTSWSLPAIIIVSGILVTIYTVAGGIEAVIWTDAVQSVVLTIGAIVAIFFLLFGGTSTPSELIDIASTAEKFSLGDFGLDFTTSTFWVVFIYGVIINLQNFGIDQSYVQRYQTASSLKEARRSVWIGALVYIPVSALFLIIGALLFSYYSANAAALPSDVTGDKVFPFFIVSELPTGFVGLLIAALFSAAISSVDTSLNSSATVLMSDVYTRFIRPDADDRAKMFFLRATSVVIGVLGTGAAILMISSKSALDVWWSWAGVFSGGMLGLFLLGAISVKARSPHAAIGAIAGLSFIVWATASVKFGFGYELPFHSLLITTVGTLTIFMVGAFFSIRQSPLTKSEPPLTLGEIDKS